MTDNAKKALDDLVDKLINSDELPGFLQKRMFLDKDIPASKWSICNQLMMLCAGTTDARGFRQWQEAGRYVKKQMKAFHILGPCTVKKTVVEDGETVQKLAIVGFKCIPVFRYEDTDGEELEYRKNMADFQPRELPLYSVAEKMGIPVSKTISFQYYGCYWITDKKIDMCTDDEQTFLHELSHAVDHELGTNGDRDEGEIVAELSACFLASLYGKSANMQYTREYVKRYSNGTHIGIKIAKLLERVSAIYEHIQEVNNEN